MSFLGRFGSIGGLFSGGMGKLGNALSWIGNKIVRPGIGAIGRIFGLSPEAAMSKAREVGGMAMEKGMKHGMNWMRDSFGKIMGKHGYDSEAQQQVVALRPLTSVENPAKSYYEQQANAMKYIRGDIPVPRAIMPDMGDMNQVPAPSDDLD